MSFAQTVLLAAIAGATIFLGLPVARIKGLSVTWQARLTAAAAGVILFLIWDILSQAIGPVEAAIEDARAGTGTGGEVALDGFILAASLAFGLLGVSLVSRPALAGSTPAPAQIALSTAIGLGFHNLSEGLAIGQSSASGQVSFALILVIGFALHNMTEGFGIAAPLARGSQPSWRFLGVLGLIGGGPTFVGGILGFTFAEPHLSIAFLGFAAGALVFVFNEMTSITRKLVGSWGSASPLLLGFLFALTTDLLLVAVGADGSVVDHAIGVDLDDELLEGEALDHDPGAAGLLRPEELVDDRVDLRAPWARSVM